MLEASMNRIIHALVRRGDRAWIAECQEIAVVTQGESLDETVTNLQEAVALHLDGEDLQALNLAPDPMLSLTVEVEPGRNAA
jgi:predicted RNase H-like HicB family nuclease